MSNAAVVWTLVSLAGALVSGWGVFDAIRGLRALQGYGNGRRIIAWGYIRAESLRFLIQAAWFVLGAALLLDGRVVMWTTPTIVLVVTNFALLCKSADDIWVRYRVRHVPMHSVGREETSLEKQDREVGDERRALQTRDAEAEE